MVQTHTTARPPNSSLRCASQAGSTPRRSSPSSGNVTRAFLLVRLDDAVDAAVPWSLTALGFEDYLWSTAAQVWVRGGNPDAAALIASIGETFAEHLWARPCLLRAEAQLHHDPDTLRRY
jgi:hypothetical protein